MRGPADHPTRRRRNLLVLAVLVVILGVLLRSDGDRGPKCLILITIDTLRADHLSAYGYHRSTSPNLDRLLEEEATLFQRTYASSPWTLPSVTSILTSLHPPQHRLVDEDVRLSPRIPTLASSLQRAGWTTVGFVGHIYVSSQFGLDHGFDEFHEFFPKPGAAKEYIDAGGMMTGVEAWLTHRADQPFFLYLHLFDPHFDYAPPPPFDRQFVDPAYQGEADGSWRFVRPYAPLDRLLGDEDLAQVVGLYDGEIRWTDEQLGRLFAFLKARDLWDDCAIVITADHGEEFQEHASIHHSRTLYEEVLRVPLVLKLPGGRRAGQRAVVAESVRGLDVAPTLLDLARVDVPPSFEGESLLPLLEAAGRDRPAFAHTVRYGSGKAALIVGRHKLIHHFGGADERYDLVSDPEERRPLPAVDDGMRQRMDAELRRMEAFDVQPERTELTEEQRKRLEALGY